MSSENQTARVLSKTMLILFISMFLIASIILGIWYAVRLSDYDTVATIKGVDISAGELRNQMYRSKIDMDEITDFDGKTQIDYLRDYALEKVKSYKLQQLLAVDYDIIKIDDISYKSFLNAMKTENEQRKEKGENNTPIYGVESYDIDTYYDYTLSNMIIALKQKMSSEGGELYTTNDKYREYYNEVKDVQFVYEDTASYKVFNLTFAGGEDKSDYTEEQAETIMKDVYNIITTNKNYLTAIPKKYPDVVVRDIDLNKDNASSASKSAKTMYEKALELYKNDVSKPFMDGYTFRIMKCYSRVSGGYRDFNEYKDAVISSYNDRYYKKHIDELCSKYKAITTKNYKKVEIS